MKTHSRASINLTSNIKFLTLVWSLQQEDFLGELFIRTRSLLFTGLASGLGPHPVPTASHVLALGIPLVWEMVPARTLLEASGCRRPTSLQRRMGGKPEAGNPPSSPTSTSHTEKLSLGLFEGHDVMKRNVTECGLLLNTRKLTDLLLGHRLKKRWIYVDKVKFGFWISKFSLIIIWFYDYHISCDKNDSPEYHIWVPCFSKMWHMLGLLLRCTIECVKSGSGGPLLPRLLFCYKCL